MPSPDFLPLSSYTEADAAQKLQGIEGRDMFFGYSISSSFSSDSLC